MSAWRMAFRDGTNGPDLWPRCRELGVAAIEYGPVDDIDLSQHSEGEPSDVWTQLAPSQQASLRRFVYEMQEGDVIYVKKGPNIVGKGIVRSPYQFDKAGRVKSSTAVWRHQRRVQWIPDFPEIAFQLGTQQIATVKRLSAEEVTTIEQLVGALGLPDEAADEAKSNDDASYAADGIDLRKQIWQQIRERRGQRQFRDGLLKRYQARCVVTGCPIVAVLEAAHIDPYRGEVNNHPENGLLLRADIHTLFDLDLLGIEPESLRVELHPSIAREYGTLAGKRLGVTGAVEPSHDALKRRYEQFQTKTADPK